MYLLSLPSLLFAAAIAVAVPVAERAVCPAVTIDNGTVIGSSALGIDSFRGIPFALPPTGNRRLKPPQTITSTYPSGTLEAIGVPTACPQFYSQDDTTNIPDDILATVEDSPLFQTVTVSGEDCLTLNVQRPSTVTSSSKLPVLFWIYGGGFEFGSTQIYDATPLIARSIALGQPIVFVAVNYRMNGFGFLAGKEVQQDGSTNLGLRDQRLALQWVQDNIAAFGGDPEKVTIWGESAGAISVFDHTVINAGDNTYNGKPLFRGAIMDSGSMIPAHDVTTSKAQTVYDTVVSNAGCSGSNDTLACLRALDYTDFLYAVTSVPAIFSYSSIDLSYFPRPDPTSYFFSVSPEVAVQNGAYAKVPIIIGDQEDEGTLFSLFQENITTTEELVTYINTYLYPTAAEADIAGLVATYPDDSSAGSPFRTGVLNELYPQYKRLAAILGDVTFNLARRIYLSYVASTVNAWSYLDSHLYGTTVLGTFHGSDLFNAFYDAPSPIAAQTVQTYYISFVNNLDPNSITTALPLIEWPQWTSDDPQLVQINAISNNLLADTFRNSSYAYFREHDFKF